MLLINCIWAKDWKKWTTCAAPNDLLTKFEQIFRPPIFVVHRRICFSTAYTSLHSIFTATIPIHIHNVTNIMNMKNNTFTKINIAIWYSTYTSTSNGQLSFCVCVSLNKRIYYFLPEVQPYDMWWYRLQFVQCPAIGSSVIPLLALWRRSIQKKKNFCSFLQQPYLTILSKSVVLKCKIYEPNVMHALNKKKKQI